MKPRFYLVPLLLFTLAACDSVSHHDEHPEAEGFRLMVDGVNVYQVLGATATCDLDSCGLDVPAGEVTSPVTIQFLDVDGHVIQEAEMEEGLSLGHEVGDTSIAAFEQSEAERPFRFRVRGQQAGTTAMVLRLLHDGDHVDFQTPPLAHPNAIPIRVSSE